MREIRAWTQAQLPRMIEDISRLVRIRSVSKKQEGPYPYGEGCAAALDAALALAKSYGLQTENHEYRCGSVLLPGRTQSELAICAHLDVVPEHTGWSHPPFEPVVRDGWLYGRGSADNKGACVASLYVLRYLREHGVELEHTLRLIYGCDEEAGMSDMAHYLATHRAPVFALVPDAGFPAACAEKAGIDAEFTCPLSGNLLAFDAGESLDCLPAHAAAILAISLEEARPRLSGREHISVRGCDGGTLVEAEGMTAHTATPEKGYSAAVRLAQALLDAGLCTGGAERALAFIAGFGCGDGSALGIACEDEESGALSIAGPLIRTRDGALHHRLNIRGPVSVPQETVWSRLCDAATGMGWSPKEHHFKPFNRISPEHPVVRLLVRYAGEAHGMEMKPYAMGGGTYARMFPNAVAAGFGLPGQKKPCPEGHGGGHQPDECVSLENLQKGVEIYVRTLMEMDRLL